MSVVNDAVSHLLHAATEASPDALVAKADREGITVSRSVIAKWRAGDIGPRPKDQTITAIAELHGVDVRRLREAIGRPPGELGPYVPDHRSASLTKGQRAALDRLIVTIVEGDSGAGDIAEKIASPSESGDELQARRKGPARPMRRAARHERSIKDHEGEQ